jgi:hypothetical protein
MLHSVAALHCNRKYSRLVSSDILSLRGEVVVRKKFSRKQLLHFTANLRVELIGIEAWVAERIFSAAHCVSKGMRCG